MTSSIEFMTISIPLTQADLTQARQFAKSQQTSAASEQVFLNTLAVLTVRHYLKMIGVSSDLDKSYSWQSITQQLSSDFADLYIPEARGRLECRSVKDEETTCHIPQAVINDRIGYVVVRFDEMFTAGEILGFVQSVSVTQLPLSYLQSLDELIDVLDDEPQPTRLGQWTTGVIDAFWQSIEAFPPVDVAFASGKQAQQKPYERQLQQFKMLYASDQSQRGTVEEDENLADQLGQLIQTTSDEEIRFQALELLWQIDSQHEQAGICKVADIGMKFDGADLVLMVALFQRTDGRYSILCRLYSTNRQRLPHNLSLSALDNEQTLLIEATSNWQDDYIQFKLVADEKDMFFAKVASPEACITECFIIE